MSNSVRRAQILYHSVKKEQRSPVTDRKTLWNIKKYCVERFGDKRYWPWLALYTELRGEFVEGWLPDVLYTEKLLPRWNPENMALISTKKSFDHRIFGEFSIPPLALVVDGVFYDAGQRELSKSNLERILAGYGGELVIKKDGAGSGDGIDFIQSRDVGSFKFEKSFGYVIQPSVEQHPAMAEMHKQSVNTLRITTFLTKKNDIHVKHRSLRFGVSENRVVNKSGLFLFLNKAGQAASEAYDGIGLSHGEKHPDTGYPYRQLRVPSIEKAEMACIEAHQKFPYLRFIAWDLYIDPEGEPHMIEWNAVRPDMWVNEALIGPLWSKEEIDEVLSGKRR